jgi:urea transporter
MVFVRRAKESKCMTTSTPKSTKTSSSLSMQSLTEFGDWSLRGVGQVMFQNNPITGALFLVGILANSIIASSTLSELGVNPAMLVIGAVLGTLISTGTAVLLGADRGILSAGLYGFNGTLVGIALPFFFQTTPLLVVYLVICSALSTIIMAMLLNFLGQWEVPALTAPFVLATWIFLVAFGSFGHLEGTGLLAVPGFAAAPASLEPLTIDQMWQGALQGVGQVMFEIHWVAGIIFLVAILVNSRISALFALIGSIIGMGVAVLLGADTALIGGGLYGFNTVLTGIALGGVFFVFNWKTAIYAVLGMVVTSIAMGGIAALLAPMGLPALTWPFIMVTWFFIFAKPMFSQLQAVPPAEAGTPEDNMKAFAQKS